MKTSLRDLITAVGILVSFAVSWGMLRSEVNAQTKDLLGLKDVPSVVGAIRADQSAIRGEIAEIRKDIRELRSYLSGSNHPAHGPSP